jgi:hypothetical protein
MSDHRAKVFEELLSTERSYSANLTRASTILILPLIEAVDQKKIPLAKNSYMPLFQKVQDVNAKSIEFISQQEQFLANPDAMPLTEVFKSFDPLVVVYFDYIQAFNYLSPDFRAERKENKALNAFCETRERELADTLQSVLIQPIQRPPRYRLLLQELIKVTADGTEKDFLQTTLTKLCGAITQIDQQMEEFEELLGKIELQSRLTDFEVVVPGRHMYFQGSAVKFSRKWTNDRWVVIFSDALLVAEIGMSKSLKVNKVYKSREYAITPVTDSPPFLNAVDVRQQSKSFRINLPKPDDKKRLIEAFEKVKKANGIKEGELEAKGFAPVWIPDDLAPACMNCGAKFSLLNRRHHCRYGGEVVCSKCFKDQTVIPGLGAKKQSVCPVCADKLKQMFGTNPAPSGEERATFDAGAEEDQPEEPK